MAAARFAIAAALLSLSPACRTAVSATGAPQPERTSLADFLPPARHALEIQSSEEDEASLAELVDLLVAATGIHVAIDPMTRSALENTPAGLRVPVQVPAEEAWRWVEGLLVHARFQLGVISNRPPQLIGVYAPGIRPDQHPEPILIEESQLAQCLEHPAFLYTLVLDLPFVDVRQLGNSLRGLAVDPSNNRAVVPIGNTNSIVLLSHGADVAALAAILKQVDEMARKQFERSPPVQAGPGQPGNPPLPASGGG
jgi:hypothetical protein